MQKGGAQQDIREQAARCEKSALVNGEHRFNSAIGAAFAISIESCEDCGMVRMALQPKSCYSPNRTWLYFKPDYKVYT